jgi:transaldolase
VGVAVVEQLLYEGINVNITLLFSVERYEEFVGAYWQGLERRYAEGKPIAGIRSVASFFLSRIDTLCDKLIAHRSHSQTAPRAADLTGKTAIASAKLAYQFFKNSLQEKRWSSLARAGAKPQRLLWASTGTRKNSMSRIIFQKVGRAFDTVQIINTYNFKLFESGAKKHATNSTKSVYANTQFCHMNSHDRLN